MPPPIKYKRRCCLIKLAVRVRVRCNTRCNVNFLSLTKYLLPTYILLQVSSSVSYKYSNQWKSHRINAGRTTVSSLPVPPTTALGARPQQQQQQKLPFPPSMGAMAMARLERRKGTWH